MCMSLVTPFQESSFWRTRTAAKTASAPFGSSRKGCLPGTDLPFVVLAGCSTGLRSARRADTDVQRSRQLRRGSDPAGRPASPRNAGPRERPIRHKTSREKLYGWLATANETDPLVALSEARRSCERKRQAGPQSAPPQACPEWATPTLLVRRPRLPLYNPDEPFGPVTAAPEPVLDWTS